MYSKSASKTRLLERHFIKIGSNAVARPKIRKKGNGMSRG